MINNKLFQAEQYFCFQNVLSLSGDCVNASNEQLNTEHCEHFTMYSSTSVPLSLFNCYCSKENEYSFSSQFFNILVSRLFKFLECWYAFILNSQSFYDYIIDLTE